MEKKERVLFADAIRVIAILFVLIIHTTSNFYVESYGTKFFPVILVISSLTSSAVPLFYMLSGSFLISEKNNSYKTFYKKFLKLFIQTIIWTIIYLLIFKFVLHQYINLFKSIMQALFTEKVGHLWYIYPLLGLYVLTPFISKLYYNISEKEKKILLLILFVIPLFLCTLQFKFWDIIVLPKFSLFFPELGLFILGKYLYDNRNKFQCKKATIISSLGIILGILSIVGFAYLHISNNGISGYKPYFDSTALPNVILDVSIYLFFASIENCLKKLPNLIKKSVNVIAKNTKGIYFIHMIFLYLLPNICIFGVHFTQNIGSIYNMLLGSILYFLMSLISVLIIKKIPLLKELI